MDYGGECMKCGAYLEHVTFDDGIDGDTEITTCRKCGNVMSVTLRVIPYYAINETGDSELGCGNVECPDNVRGACKNKHALPCKKHVPPVDVVKKHEKEEEDSRVTEKNDKEKEKIHEIVERMEKDGILDKCKRFLDDLDDARKKIRSERDIVYGNRYRLLG